VAYDYYYKLGTGKIDPVFLAMQRKLIEDMDPLEFQQWAVFKVGGTVSKSKSGDMGIDGILGNGNPIQVKKSIKVGRPEIDQFETAIRRLYKREGTFIAYSFTGGARVEVNRAMRDEHIEITLLTVNEIISQDYQRSEAE
jgi:hypothetical protein